MVVDPQAMDSSSTTAIVFARLDPILKRLLEGLTKLKNLLPFLLSTRNNDNETTFVRLSKSIAGDLESLSKGLVVAQQQQNQRLQHAKALCLLAKYITLPLNAVFRLPLREIYGTPDGTIDPKLSIRRSYVYRMYRLAAIAMEKFIEETTIDNNNNSSSSHNLLPTTTWIEHLVALIHVLPSYEETNKNNTTNSLDDGTDVFVEILSTTRTLLKCFDSNALLQAWHGTLSMRLVDSLTAFLVHKVYSPRVHTAALETLATLFQVTNETSNSSSSFWRSVFPGVFTALYKIIANDTASNRSSKASSTTSTVQIFKLSLKSLISLLKITLSSSSDDETDGTIRNSSDTELNSNDDLLAKLNSMVITANSNKSEDEEKDERIDEKEPSQQKFFHQIRKKIEGPLIFVLRHLSVSPNDEIRRDVVRLSHVILLETRWGNPSQSTFENHIQVPLEICIGFQQDPDASVRAAAREIIDHYSMDSPSVWMVPRIIELIQKLLTLVHRGRSTTTENGIFGRNANTELRTNLNLVAGYLQCLDRSAKESKTITTSICNSFVASKQLRRGLIRKFRKVCACCIVEIFAALLLYRALLTNFSFFKSNA